LIRLLEDLPVVSEGFQRAPADAGELGIVEVFAEIAVGIGQGAALDDEVIHRIAWFVEDDKTQMCLCSIAARLIGK